MADGPAPAQHDKTAAAHPQEAAAVPTPSPTPAAAAHRPPPNVTAVTTAAGLQEAVLAGHQNIEIRAHLDLRSLSRIPNPSMPTVKPVALLYSGGRKPQSVRGNCSDGDPAATLGVTSDVAVSLLPLKERQCLILMPDTFLMVNNGILWLDNIYLRLLRRVRTSFISFVTAGLLATEEEFPDLEISASEIALTNITFQGEHAHDPVGVAIGPEGSVLLVNDCIFMDWRGAYSPLNIRNGAASVVNTDFRNMRLSVEIADVSYSGAVRFRNTALVNVDLQQGAVVSTTTNDYNMRDSPVEPELYEYLPEDDDGFDVAFKQVPPGKQGMPGVEFIISDATMSDCIVLTAAATAVLPGCPPESVQRRRAVRDRQRLSPRYSNDLASSNRDASIELWLERALAMEDSGWLPELREYLGAPPAPADTRPPFSPAPDDVQHAMVYPAAVGRGSIAKVRPVPPGMLVPVLQADLHVDREVLSPPGNSVRGGPGHDVHQGAFVLWAVAVLVVGVMAAALVWATVKLRWLCGSRGRGRAGAQGLIPTLQRKEHQPPVVWSSAPEGESCAGAHERVPRSAMNPDFEYALPAHLAELMRGRLPGMDAPEEHNHGVTTASSQRPSWSRILTGRGGSSDRSTVSSLGNYGLHGSWNGAVRPMTDVHADGDSTRAASRLARHWSGAATAEEGRHGGGPGVRIGIAEPWQTTDEPGHTLVLPPYGSEYNTQSPLIISGSMHSAASSSAHTLAGTLGSSYSCSSRGPTCSRRLLQETVLVSACTPTHVFGACTAARDITAATVAHERGDSAVVAADSAAHAQLQVRRLRKQLDCFGEQDIFLGRFEMLGRQHQRCGGQGVVQFAEAADGTEFAVKFFLDRASFVTEAALYAAAFPHILARASPEVADAVAAAPRSSNNLAAAVARVMPQVEVVCDGAAGGLEDPRGRPLPPCIVMEKGESLNDWSDRAAPDLFTCLAVLSNLSKCLANMHDAGYIHRDLKPSNVMWLPRQNRWTVIDFGCVACVGETAPLTFTLAYAAPEVAEAFHRQQAHIEAAVSLDTWSLGVMAFELLTGAPAFNFLQDGPEGVMRRLRGQLPLPWEGGLSEGVRRRLGVLRGPVLQLLQRAPSRRGGMRAFHTTCTSLFNSKPAT